MRLGHQNYYASRRRAPDLPAYATGAYIAFEAATRAPAPISATLIAEFLC